MVKIRHFLCILHLLIAIGFSNDVPTILISFDGMRFDYLNKTSTPNFDELISNGVASSKLCNSDSFMPISISLGLPAKQPCRTAPRRHPSNKKKFIFLDFINRRNLFIS